jgi:4'-phosphopantetheinyl transferase
MESDIVLFTLEIEALSSLKIETLESIATPRSLTGAHAFRERIDRLRFFAGRALLRYGLRDFIGSKEVVVALGDHGRPYLPAQPRIDFNIAHSGVWVLCLIGKDRRVGVDVELIAETIEGVVDRFSAVETAYLHSRRGRDRGEAFYQIWTAKEAYLKATGDTFRNPLDQFSINIGMGKPTLSFNDDTVPITWNLESGNLDGRHVYGACFSGVPTEVERTEVAPQDLFSLD